MNATSTMRRGAGRPTAEQAETRHEELLDAALDLFLGHGFELTTIEMVATRISMTVYARYADKASLFRAAVQRAIERQIVPRDVLEGFDKGDLTETLEAVARLRIGQVMSPNGLRLQRIINTESYRFPEIFTANLEQSAKPVIDFVAGLLDRAIAAGQIFPTDSGLAASAFMSMVVGGPRCARS
jgi:TetR/AcrR family transcriptional repressor of mexJK operon